MVGPCSAKLQFDRSGRSSGAATVKFDKAGDAQTAVKKYNNVELDGKLFFTQ
jgi:THO complex subunit 4